MSVHSRIAPSSAHIWGAPNGCTGYVKMAEHYPELEESEEAREGTASHEIGEQLITAATRANVGRPTKESLVGSFASNGVVITDEMYECAELYANDVVEVMRDRKIVGGNGFGVEHRIEAKDIHAESFGTVDAFLFDPSKMELFIWDYKFGHSEVTAFENWQAINYASGLLNELGIDGTMDSSVTVRIRIVQPRSYTAEGPIREWVINAADLRPYFNTLANGATKALSDEATTLSGEHCKNCEARHACSAALQAGLRLYEVASKPVPQELSREALGTQLTILNRAKKQLEYLISGYEAQVASLLKSGETVPGWSVKEGKGRPKWSKPLGEVIALGELMGKNLLKDPEAVTPAQAKKLGIDAGVIAAYSEIPSTGLKVVPQDENKARNVFTKQ